MNKAEIEIKLMRTKIEIILLDHVDVQSGENNYISQDMFEIISNNIVVMLLENNLIRGE